MNENRLSTKALTDLKVRNDAQELPVNYERTLTVGVVASADKNMVRLFYEICVLTLNTLRPYWSFGVSNEEYMNKHDFRDEEKKYELNGFMAVMAGLFSSSLKTKFNQWSEDIRDIVEKQAVDEFMEYPELKERLPAFGLRFDLMTNEQIERTEGCPRLDNEQLKAIVNIWKPCVIKRVNLIRKFVLLCFRSIVVNGVENAFEGDIKNACSDYVKDMNDLMDNFKRDFDVLSFKRALWCEGMRTWYNTIVRSCGNLKFDNVLSLKGKLEGVAFGDIVNSANVWYAVFQHDNVVDNMNALLEIEGVRTQFQKSIENELDYRLRYRDENDEPFKTGVDDDMVELIMNVYGFTGSAYHDFIVNLIKVYGQTFAQNNSVFTILLTNIVKAINVYLAMYTYWAQGLENPRFEALLCPDWKDNFREHNSINRVSTLIDAVNAWEQTVMGKNLNFEVELIVFVNPGENLKVAYVKDLVKSWARDICVGSKMITLKKVEAFVPDLRINKSVVRNMILQRARGCFVSLCDADDLPKSIIGLSRLIESFMNTNDLGIRWDSNIRRSIAGFYSSPNGKELGCNGYVIIRPAWICNSWGWCSWFNDDGGVSAERLITNDVRFGGVGEKIFSINALVGIDTIKEFGGPYERLRKVRRITDKEELVYSKWTDYWAESILNNSLNVDESMLRNVKDSIKTHIDRVVCGNVIGYTKNGYRIKFMEESKVWMFAGIRYNRRARLAPETDDVNDGERKLPIHEFNSQLDNTKFYGGEQVERAQYRRIPLYEYLKNSSDGYEAPVDEHAGMIEERHGNYTSYSQPKPRFNWKLIWSVFVIVVLVAVIASVVIISVAGDDDNDELIGKNKQDEIEDL